MFVEKTYVCKDCGAVNKSYEIVPACPNCSGAVVRRNDRLKALYQRMNEEERFKPRELRH